MEVLMNHVTFDDLNNL